MCVLCVFQESTRDKGRHCACVRVCVWVGGFGCRGVHKNNCSNKPLPTCNAAIPTHPACEGPLTLLLPCDWPPLACCAHSPTSTPQVWDLRNHKCLQTLTEDDWRRPEEAKPNCLFYDAAHRRCLTGVNKPYVWVHKMVAQVRAGAGGGRVGGWADGRAGGPVCEPLKCLTGSSFSYFCLFSVHPPLSFPP